MKLSKLYTNRPEIFEPLVFNTGFNVVLAEIRLAENKNKDTHNLGKSTIARLIDYCLLAARDPRFFLFRHIEIFAEFDFFLEIELLDHTYLTVCRGVEDASRINFRRHLAKHQDFNDIDPREWDHFQVPFERAREILDGLLDWSALRPYSYRKSLGYLLRTQDSFRDVFMLLKQIKHNEWKPYLAYVLGFNSTLVEDLYRKETKVTEAQTALKAITKELGGEIDDIGKIEGILFLKQQDAEKKKALLDAFDFRSHDKEVTKQIVDSIDEEISSLNAERYSLTKNRKKIASSLEQHQILFNPESAQQIFKEAGVVFGGQIKKDFEQLIQFNRALSEERRKFLVEERTEIDARLKVVNAALSKLGAQRSEKLSYLSSTDVFARYRELSDELVTLRADIATLERQKECSQRLLALRVEIRALQEQRGHLQTQIEADVEKQNSEKESLFSTIRLYFNEIVETVIDRKALLSISPNKEGHLEFKAEILDESGNATAADRGFSYRKLLCVAFDLALLRAHVDHKFPRFVFHDGVFESLDDRKKENLLEILHQYAEFGLQPIITLIDSDLPARASGEDAVFNDDEVVLLLHDEGDEGRLFRMPNW